MRLLLPANIFTLERKNESLHTYSIGMNKVKLVGGRLKPGAPGLFS